MRGSQFETMIQGLNIVVADRNQFMRRLTRTMLMNLGARVVVEAVDGLTALEAIRTCDPDLLFLEWDLPVLDGMEVIRIVRSPGVFPRPALPIVMLTNRAERSCVLRALRAGVHEFLIKPTSPQALRDRISSVMLKPRPMTKLGDFYVPEPRCLMGGDIAAAAAG
jgi:two-component system, chemotaxis family, chemotaxis protein CheY